MLSLIASIILSDCDRGTFNARLEQPLPALSQPLDVEVELGHWRSVPARAMVLESGMLLLQIDRALPITENEITVIIPDHGEVVITGLGCRP